MTITILLIDLEERKGTGKRWRRKKRRREDVRDGGERAGDEVRVLIIYLQNRPIF